MKRIWIVVVLVLLCLNLGSLTQAFDFNGDGADDVAIFRPSSGLWAVRGVTRSYFGTWNDEPAIGDYNGDGAAEIAIYRASTGLWAIRNWSRIYFGGAGDLPVGGSDGDWYRSGDNLCAIAAGNIGIGTGTPLEKLHLENQAAIPDIRLQRGSGGEYWDIGGSSGVYLNFDYMGTTNVTFAINGNVGIGETSPAELIHMVGSNPRLLIDASNSNPEVNFRSASTAADWSIYLEDSSDTLRFYRGVDQMTINTSGNVGIGTTDPSAKLEVSGQIFLEDMAPLLTPPTGHSGLHSWNGELFADDDQGNSTQISAHDQETGKWIFYSENERTGRVLRIEMEELIFDLAEEMSEKTGKQYIFEQTE